MTATPICSSPFTVALISVASAIVLAACGPEGGTPVATTTPVAPVVAQTPAATPAPAPRARPVVERERERAPVVRDTGRVVSIEPITEARKTTGAGAVLGGVAGGVIGNQIGDGNGRKAATVLGAVGGAFAGNEVEKRRADKIVGYRVGVRMDDGGTRTVRLAATDGLDIGERVRVDGDNLHRI